MDAQVLTATGLLIDLCGAVLIFFNSPKMSYKTILYNDHQLDRLQKKADRMHLLARFGMILLVIGFGMQLTSNFFG